MGTIQQETVHTAGRVDLTGHMVVVLIFQNAVHVEREVPAQELTAVATIQDTTRPDITALVDIMGTDHTHTGWL